MAQPNTQAGLGHTPGAAGQPQVAQRQAPVGEKTMTQPVHRPLESGAGHAVPAPHSAQGQPASRSGAPATPPEDDQEGSDWGLAPVKSGITRENKFILFVLLILVAVFSFVVFRNFQKKQGAAKTSELAAKDGKSKKGDEHAEHEHKKLADGETSHHEEGNAPPLQEPRGENDPFVAGHEAKSGHDTKAEPQEAADPFGAAASSEEPPATKHRASHRTRRSAEPVLNADQEAPPQLDTFAQDTPTQEAAAQEAPAQTSDLFERPADAAATEFADATPPTRHRRGEMPREPEATQEMTAETTAEAPTQINESVESDPMLATSTEAESMQQPAEITAFDVSEPVAENGFAQTGGTAAEPIRQRATSPQATGAANFDAAQSPAHSEMLNSQDPATSTTPRATSPRATSPRTTTPRTTSPRATSPRTSIEPTPAAPLPPTTQPRVGSVPPPLDPNDPRLGGYREAELPPVGAPHRTASRPHTPAPTGHIDARHEPLVANVGEYIVRPNDSYWRISRKVYGTSRYFAALAKHNEATVHDPRHMKPGIKISTPSKEQLEQHYGNLLPVIPAPRPVGAITHSPNAPKTPGFYVEADGQPAYRIGPNDNLSSISQKTLGRSTRWEEIYDLNRDRLAGADALSVGSILRLPPDASQTRVVGKPVEHR